MTLETFRGQVIKRHTSNMESLMLESFQKLLRKTELVKALSIDSSTFEATLTGRDGKNLPFDRLSAGERQLLATSMLWGLARASGRPIPTIIDTPLGRLDSEHRSHLIERYFPNASHQVLLLSTDEEISNDYLEALRPAITSLPSRSRRNQRIYKHQRGLLRMRSPVETVRVSARGREILIKMKRSTGLEHWNELCRVAICRSLANRTPPPRFPGGGESSVEMEWKTFAGAVGSELSALILLRATADGIDVP